MPLEVFRQWNSVADFWCIFIEISANNDKFGYLNPILGTLEVMHDLGWWLAGKPMVDFLFPLIELSSLSVTVPELWGELCTARLFWQGSTVLHLNFAWTGSSPRNHSWHQKTRDTGLPHVKTASFCIHSFWHNTGVWRTNGRTDRRTDLPKHIQHLQGQLCGAV